MSVGFGFSIGDFLATINLVGTVINALRESSHSTAAFRELLNELYILEKTLINVKHIELDESQHFEKIALYQAAAQCQRSIDAFWNKVKIYQPHLSQSGTTYHLKDGWMKIKWAVCKKGDVEDFRAEVQAHVSSIQVLMGAIQLNASTRNAQNQQKQYKSLAGSIQEFSSRAMGKLHAVANGVARNVRQSNHLLHICAEVLQTNLRVFQMIYDIQLFITQIPGQVNRQQPVYMVDPFNKESPFHLEFVRSAEALLAILKVNLKETGCGPDMIDRGEFVIEEAGTRNVIDITQNWETCFYPGQRVAMSMIFKKKERRAAQSSCPRCQKENDGSTDEEVTW